MSGSERTDLPEHRKTGFTRAVSSLSRTQHPLATGDPAQRRAWIQTVSATDFEHFTTHTNHLLRNEPGPSPAQPDGKFVRVPSANLPAAADRPQLLRRTLETMKLIAKDPRLDNAAALRQCGVVFGYMLPILHPYRGGNGRTGRFVGALLDLGVAGRREALAKLDQATTGDGATNWQLSARKAWLEEAQSGAANAYEAHLLRDAPRPLSDVSFNPSTSGRPTSRQYHPIFDKVGPWTDDEAFRLAVLSRGAGFVPRSLRATMALRGVDPANMMTPGIWGDELDIDQIVPALGHDGVNQWCEIEEGFRRVKLEGLLAEFREPTVTVEVDGQSMSVLDAMVHTLETKSAVLQIAPQHTVALDGR